MVIVAVEPCCAQSLPSAETYAARLFEVRTSLSQYGVLTTGLVPRTVLPNAADRYWKSTPEVASRPENAYFDSGDNVSRIITPTFAVPLKLVVLARRAMIVPSPLIVW